MLNDQIAGLPAYKMEYEGNDVSFFMLRVLLNDTTSLSIHRRTDTMGIGNTNTYSEYTVLLRFSENAQAIRNDINQNPVTGVLDYSFEPGTYDLESYTSKFSSRSTVDSMLAVLTDAV